MGEALAGDLSFIRVIKEGHFFMACKIADNEPLQRLRKDLGVPFQCHSLRDHCQQGADRRLGKATMGGAGAAIGYCQALFNRAGTSDIQSRLVLEVLSTINAPWSQSHELFWGYRHDETAAGFLQNALEPLTDRKSTRLNSSH